MHEWPKLWMPKVTAIRLILRALFLLDMLDRNCKAHKGRCAMRIDIVLVCPVALAGILIDLELKARQPFQALTAPFLIEVAEGKHGARVIDLRCRIQARKHTHAVVWL